VLLLDAKACLVWATLDENRRSSVSIGGETGWFHNIEQKSLLEQAVSYRTTGNELSHQSSAGKTRVGQTERSFRSVTNTGDSFVRYCEPSTELWLPLALDADMASNSVKLM
jgi:hypothetical protein